MLIGAKTARPVRTKGEIQHQIFRAQIDSPLVIIQASPGCLHTESLVGALDERSKPLIWLRFGAEDRDPANCLLSLIGALGKYDPQMIESTLELIRREPGPLFGWPRPYAHLASSMSQHIPEPITFVLENVNYLGSPLPSLPLLAEHFLPRLPDHIQVILTSSGRLAINPPARPAAWINERDLLLNENSVRALFSQSGIDLTAHSLQRIIHLTQGKATPLSCLYRVGAQLGDQYLDELTQHKRQFSQALMQYLHDSLESMDRASIESLSILAALGYFHPNFQPAQTENPVNPDGPWAGALEGGWLRLHGVARVPLQRTLERQQLFHTGILGATVDYLCQNQACEEGVRLLLQSGLTNQATAQIVAQLPVLLSNGQWSLLEGWLAELPPSVKNTQPWLAYARGEIDAARGDTAHAAKAFQQARKGFAQAGDREGLWLAWIALTTLAVWQNDLPQARSCAHNALAAAPASWQIGWSEYLLGWLTLSGGDSAAASAHLVKAIDLSANQSVRDHIAKIESLAQRQEQIETERSHQRQTLKALDQEEEQIRLHLETLLTHSLESDLGPAEWIKLPLIAKLPTPYQPSGSPLTIIQHALQQKLSLMFRRQSPVLPPAAPQPLPTQPADVQPEVRQTSMPRVEPPLESDTPAQTPSALIPAASEELVEPNAPSTLTAYMLGLFRLSINDNPNNRLPGGRNGSLLKYLIYHHSQRLPREVLMEAFWPDADPEAARNRLNVALHQVRRGLQLVDNEPILLFEDGRYGIRSDVKVWLDVEEFEHNLQVARKQLSAGQPEHAASHLEAAASLYLGDFLLEDPYEEWAVAIRERLRLAYLDALDQLSRYYYKQGQYPACVSLCQRILEKDNVREDAHCLLMRCYGHLNQFHLALRQYQVCAETLRKELKVEPARSTQDLYNRMRRREVTIPRRLA